LIKERNNKKNVTDKLKIPLLSKKWLLENLENMNFNVDVLKYNKTGTTIFVCVKKN